MKPVKKTQQDRSAHVVRDADSLDYLFLAFTAATALSPAETYPLTRLSKVLMMLEAVLSLTVAGILIARAVNLLGG